MTTELAQGRARRAGWIAGLAAAFAIVAAVTVGIQMRGRSASQSAGVVLPAFAEHLRDATRIVVLSKDARYEIQRTDKGWVLKDRGNFPVKREQLGKFTDGLRSLVYVRPMTHDPERLERLGLGDPAQGGSGVLVQVEDGQGARLADIIVGQAPGGALFVRKPGDNQSWQVRGTLPSLRDASQWLELTPLSIDAARIAGADVQPATGPAYVVSRDSVEASFSIVGNTAPVASPGGVADAALKVADLQPNDVRPAAAISGTPSARLRMRTFDGLAIEGEVYAEAGGRHWLKLVARADKPEKEGEAREINARVAPWAYSLSDAEALALAPALSTLVRAPEPPPEDPKAKAKARGKKK